MLISEREAARLLDVEAGLSRTPARRLLRTGVAGTPAAGPGRLMYERDRVAGLGGWPVLIESQLAVAAPNGLAVARLVDQPCDVTASWSERRAAFAGPWEMGLVFRLAVAAYIDCAGSFPLIVTVSGFVIGGADIVAPVGFDDGPCALELAEPGRWFGALRGHRWLPGRGGRPLHWWQPGQVPRARAAASRAG